MFSLMSLRLNVIHTINCDLDLYLFLRIMCAPKMKHQINHPTTFSTASGCLAPGLAGLLLFGTLYDINCHMFRQQSKKNKDSSCEKNAVNKNIIRAIRSTRMKEFFIALKYRKAFLMNMVYHRVATCRQIS